MYRVVRRTAPVYLAELCQPCTDPRRRSTAAREDFEIPRNNRRFTNSSFSIAAPTAWNCLHTFVPLQLCHRFYPDSRLTRTLHHLLFLRLSYYVRRPRALIVGRPIENAILID